jgi:hypothetical protein
MKIFYPMDLMTHTEFIRATGASGSTEGGGLPVQQEPSSKLDNTQPTQEGGESAFLPLFDNPNSKPVSGIYQFPIMPTKSLSSNTQYFSPQPIQSPLLQLSPPLNNAPLPVNRKSPLGKPTGSTKPKAPVTRSAAKRKTEGPMKLGIKRSKPNGENDDPYNFGA